VVELIESRYPRFPGLNLSYEVLEGLRKHDRGYTRENPVTGKGETFPSPSLEAQIANLSDEITYYSHDIDDGIDHHLISEDQLADLELWQICTGYVKEHFPELRGKRFRSYAIRSLIDHEVENVVEATHRRLEEAGAGSSDEVRRSKTQLVDYSDSLKRANRELRSFLYENLYYHEEVSGPNQSGRERTIQLWQKLWTQCAKRPNR